MLTPKEKEAIELTGQAASLIFEIIRENGNFENDAHEIAAACHVMQRFVMSNAAARAHPGQYRLLGAPIISFGQCDWSYSDGTHCHATAVDFAQWAEGSSLRPFCAEHAAKVRR